MLHVRPIIIITWISQNPQSKGTTNPRPTFLIILISTAGISQMCTESWWSVAPSFLTLLRVVFVRTPPQFWLRVDRALSKDIKSACWSCHSFMSVSSPRRLLFRVYIRDEMKAHLFLMPCLLQKVIEHYVNDVCYAGYRHRAKKQSCSTKQSNKPYLNFSVQWKCVMTQ